MIGEIRVIVMRKYERLPSSLYDVSVHARMCAGFNNMEFFPLNIEDGDNEIFVKLERHANSRLRLAEIFRNIEHGNRNPVWIISCLILGQIHFVHQIDVIWQQYQAL